MSDQEELIDSFSRSLEPVDREPFRRAAEEALAQLPVYRAVELAWRGFFRPPDGPARSELLVTRVKAAGSERRWPGEWAAKPLMLLPPRYLGGATVALASATSSLSD